ncbi:uncharacterized protein ASCRUDRAFT_78273 [Ascoidea rubescens DSM 1968]|uniref:Altered inheritance of mitochondria protein 24, mitochondrial n=1 Tax=Ascoidea rubescens DSM 1968 TaxID=1344418 RepID=A0A1D2V8F1_9ASCO|nr:hypothetical protein ASCRUDRAFT_78273 [Ascoidea rubescens DSM 1968]ODV57971.1 hypothetical protein ASCRUDRAFT_78273 [Ascoidea rubescens DSM 1968]
MTRPIYFAKSASIIHKIATGSRLKCFNVFANCKSYSTTSNVKIVDDEDENSNSNIKHLRNLPKNTGSGLFIELPTFKLLNKSSSNYLVNLPKNSKLDLKLNSIISIYYQNDQNYLNKDNNLDLNLSLIKKDPNSNIESNLVTNLPVSLLFNNVLDNLNLIEINSSKKKFNNLIVLNKSNLISYTSSLFLDCQNSFLKINGSGKMLIKYDSIIQLFENDSILISKNSLIGLSNINSIKDSLNLSKLNTTFKLIDSLNFGFKSYLNYLIDIQSKLNLSIFDNLLALFKKKKTAKEEYQLEKLTIDNIDTNNISSNNINNKKLKFSESRLLAILGTLLNKVKSKKGQDKEFYLIQGPVVLLIDENFSSVIK